MTYAVATDGPPPRDDPGAGVSDRFQRSRIPALPTVLFADASRGLSGDGARRAARGPQRHGHADGRRLRRAARVPAAAGATEGAVTPVPSLIVIDADLPGHPARQGGGRGDQGRPQDTSASRSWSWAATTTPRRSPRCVRRGREHVHRQAGHVPRARAADEGLHGLLAGDRGVAARQRGRGLAPWHCPSTRSASWPSRPTTRTTRRSARCSRARRSTMS